MSNAAKNHDSEPDPKPREDGAADGPAPGGLAGVPPPPPDDPTRYAKALPSGRMATYLRNVTGDHVTRAMRLLGAGDVSNALLIGWAIASIVAKVDGDRFKIEDRGNFSRDDFMALATEGISGKEPSSQPDT